MPSKLAMPILEFGAQKEAVARLYVSDTASNAQITSVFNATVAILLGSVTKSILELAVDKDAGTTVAPTDPFAQREIRWEVKGRDTVNQKVCRFTIPCADLDLLATGNNLSLTTEPGLSFKNAVEAIWVNDIGNPVAMTEVKLLGKKQ